MRFDDRLSTVLEGSYDSPRARILRWQQLTDIVAQDGPALPEAVAVRALHMIALLGREVPPETVNVQAAAVAAQSRYAPLLVWLAGQNADAAEAVMTVAQLSDEQWLSALPQLGPLSRSLLRRRTNLSLRVQQALKLFAAGDMALSDRSTAELVAAKNPAEIRNLVRRIEEYRQRQQAQTAVGQPAEHMRATSRVPFVTDANARIIDAETRGRGRFVGIDLAQPAAAFETGCDAGTARIVGKRGRIDAGRLLIQGEDRWSGTWLCEAEPRFAAEDGAFRGYTGTLRRPLRHEVVAMPDKDPAHDKDAEFRPDLLRQLMHELRSPLNAIGGFAQLIEGQYAGPVAAVYIAAARTIIAETAKLGEVIDEIDLLAQMSSAAVQSDGSTNELRSALLMVAAELRSSRRPVDLILSFDESDRILASAMSPPELSRILHLWLQPLGDRQASPLPLAVRRDGNGVQLVVDLQQDVFSGDPNGLGFAFSAAVELASQSGGSLYAQADQHILNIPLLVAEPASGERVG